MSVFYIYAEPVMAKLSYMQNLVQGVMYSVICWLDLKKIHNKITKQPEISKPNKWTTEPRPPTTKPLDLF